MTIVQIFVMRSAPYDYDEVSIQASPYIIKDLLSGTNFYVYNKKYTRGISTNRCGKQRIFVKINENEKQQLVNPDCGEILDLVHEKFPLVSTHFQQRTSESVYCFAQSDNSAVVAQCISVKRTI